MAEDGDSTNKQMPYSNRSHHQDTYKRTPESEVDHRYQARSTGIISLPPGSRGPRSLYLRRHGDNFGFTLRHFIVYPPDSVQETLGNRHRGFGAILTPMDTIFVKNVSPYSPAEQSGLQRGDRIVAVNGFTVTDKTYAQVIHLIQNSPQYLHLLVVPKEEDILQKFFADTAHNPVSNQLLKQELYTDRRKLYRPGQFTAKPTEYYADAASWNSLQEASYHGVYDTVAAQENHRQQQQKSADNLLYVNPREILNQGRSQEIIDEPNRISRAQPQVPIRKMGRRASEGSTYANQDFYLDNLSSATEPSEMVVSGANMKASAKAAFLNTAGCRLSLDGGSRRESASSLTSSIADSSKESLSSYESVSTVTGQQKEDSVMMTRLRKNLQQKEEFLRRPSHPMEPLTIQREFYSRPKRLDKPTWPPNEPTKQESSPRTAKPVHQNFQRVKADIDVERDRVAPIFGDYASGGAVTNVPQQRGVASPYVPVSVDLTANIPEALPAPSNLEHPGQMNGAASVLDEDRKLYLNNLQVVSKRARQFESGRPIPEDDLMLKDRTSFYKSELARLSSKRVVPHVTIRAHEFESRSSEPRRDTSSSSANSQLRRHHRDSRSVDSSEMLREHDTQPVSMRARSNSADSWTILRAERNTHIDQQKNEDNLAEQELQEAQISSHAQLTSHLVPKPIDHLPVVAITPPKSLPVRPTQLDLNGPIRSAKQNYLCPPGDSTLGQSVSPVDSEENKPLVVRRTKNTNLVLPDEERVMRRESYLKATGNGRMHVDECSDGDISPHAIRSIHRKWRPPLFPGDIQQLRKLFEDAAYSIGGSVSGGSSSSISLEKEKISLSSNQLEKEVPTIKEGFLNCKIAEIDGKRAADRSWKQVWTVLKGPRLFIYKDRPHQSPSEASEQSLVNGVDISTACVKIAEDYTKRKHVLRVSSINPYRSELLLQAENTIDLANWVKVLQEQSPASNDIDGKVDSTYQQQALPQPVPSATTVQVESSSRLSPQPSKSKLPSLRNRSPTGQSPVSKTRKPSQINEGLTSPKSKTWRGRVAKQFKKIQGNTSPSSPTAPEGSTFGVPLEHCFPSNNNPHVPRIVELCTEIVESKGLDIIGVYRVPGNSAAITVLTNIVNNSYECVQPTDPQWSDVHVVSSLLKSYFRKLPDSLLTSALYSAFIEADKNEDPSVRMEEIRKLINCLPPHHYYTMRHVMLHLRNVTDNSNINKMEARNLAIVFGPTLIRAVQDDMATLVNDMTHNYKIVESLISFAHWFFSDDDVSCLNLPTPSPPVDLLNNELDVVSNRTLLLDNISKVESLKGEKIHGRELFSSIISAAHRKMRKGTKVNTSQDPKDELGSPNSIKEFTSHSNFNTDLKHNLVEHKASSEGIQPTVRDIEKVKHIPKETWFNYSNEEQFRRRIENFIQETQANLQRHRKTANFYSSNLEQAVPIGLNNVGPEKNSASDSYVLSKTQSVSNVFHRPISNNSNLTAVQYRGKKPDNCVQVQNSDKFSNLGDFDLNQNKELFKNNVSTLPKPFNRTLLRRGNSTENINSAVIDVGSTNGSLKKVKYANENEVQRTGSLDSIHNLHVAEEGDLQSSIMKIFDEKQKTLNPLGSAEDLPYADESPERHPKFEQNKENIPASPKLYRNPSLHKNAAKLSKVTKEIHVHNLNEEKEKDCLENVPDNERYISNTEKVALNNINNINFSLVSGNCTKLRRSESLNKPERTVSPLNNKLKRSESLNKASDRLKRSDSLTKNEKTENNLNKRRELTAAARRTNKEFSKLKRKNGMPERSIKRRHTVGGTKDFDKANYWLDNRYQEENNEKCNRTSSPDLSSTRRERLFFEVNLIGPENMVVALRQHLIGARPQSLPEPRIFTVPLESHV